MKACHEIRPWLEWLAADELEGEARRRVEEHLRACPDCRRGLGAWRSLLAAAARPAAEAAAELPGIDWDAVSDRIMAGIGTRPAPRRRPAPLFPFAYLAAAAALVAVVGLGLFFRARVRSVSPLPSGNSRLSASAADRLRSGMAREEVIAYLQQSQLMLTDLLKDCASEEIAPWEIRLYSSQAKELLLKKKYFQQSLPELEWLKVKNISERIDWVNYEILQLEGRQLCSQVNRLQRIMESENLLLKIRLLEKDLSATAYQEV
jgi:hypothetical protein